MPRPRRSPERTRTSPTSAARTVRRCRSSRRSAGSRSSPPPARPSTPSSSVLPVNPSPVTVIARSSDGSTPSGTSTSVTRGTRSRVHGVSASGSTSVTARDPSASQRRLVGGGNAGRAARGDQADDAAVVEPRRVDLGLGAVAAWSAWTRARQTGCSRIRRARRLPAAGRRGGRGGDVRGSCPDPPVGRLRFAREIGYGEVTGPGRPPR